MKVLCNLEVRKFVSVSSLTNLRQAITFFSEGSLLFFYLVNQSIFHVFTFLKAAHLSK